jgi:hypothetical protein
MFGKHADMTRIEQALFLDNSAHCIGSFELSSEALVLTLHPWERTEISTLARFERPRIVSTDDRHADGEHELPWDIIGFDSEQSPSGDWRFCLHTDCIEYVFDSPWPEITKIAEPARRANGRQS